MKIASAVQDAVLLSKAWDELTAINNISINADENAKAILEAVVPDSDWVTAAAHESALETMLANAIKSGRLPIWHSDGGNEQPVDYSTEFGSDWEAHRSIRTGRHFRMAGGQVTAEERPSLFIKRKDWSAFIKETLVSIRRQKGRPPGRGGYAEADKLLVVRMKQMMDADASMTKNGAARMLAPEAMQGGAPESIVRRLVRAFDKQYPIDKK